MATGGTSDSHLYVGLAGETGRGRVVQSGLWRMAARHADCRDTRGIWPDLNFTVIVGLGVAPFVRAVNDGLTYWL